MMWLPAACLGLLAFGLLFLGAYCVAEALANPGYSLIDAYWRGRLPWMGIAEGLIVGGATACAVTGTAVVLWLGGPVRRVLAIPAVLAVALWWFLAVAMTSMRATACEVGTPCPAPTPDPWAWAYSAPEQALLVLILPGVFLSVLAILSRPQLRVPATT
jgi:hypothetical protein